MRRKMLEPTEEIINSIVAYYHLGRYKDAQILAQEIKDSDNVSICVNAK